MTRSEGPQGRDENLCCTRHNIVYSAPWRLSMPPNIGTALSRLLKNPHGHRPSAQGLARHALPLQEPARFGLPGPPMSRFGSGEACLARVLALGKPFSREFRNPGGIPPWAATPAAHQGAHTGAPLRPGFLVDAGVAQTGRDPCRLGHDDLAKPMAVGFREVGYG